GRQLNRILEARLAAARAEIGTGPPASIAEEALRRCLSEIEAAARERGIELRIGFAGAHLVDVGGDLLERMLAPLLDNAARFARSSIVVAVGGSSDRVTITIEDDGPGIAADELERIFEAGYRGGPPTGQAEADGTGAGLGLALCRRLARAAGGEVRALPGATGAAEGATFELTVPSAN
ncbi:MAG: HAMP domain-containing sensor histidine kinase, partial [Solirubrobacterales bacterium]